LTAALSFSCCFALWGCTPLAGPSDPPPGVSVELESVPFFPQARFQCGPAALATVLGSSGVAIAAEALVDDIYLPGRRGSLQDEISAASRRHGRIPFPVQGSEEALVEELLAGHPVLILQNLGLTVLPRWHYAVVVGHRAEDGRWVLRSGRERRQLMRSRRFTGSWQRAGAWGLVILPPGELPARARAGSVARTLATAESVLGAAAVLPSWEAAARRWTDQVDLAFGVGNAARAAGHPRRARQHYRRALALDDEHLAARNNLADLELELGCADNALATIMPALEATGADHPLRKTLAATAASARTAVNAEETGPGACN
jgi:hypothetical protein